MNYHVDSYKLWYEFLCRSNVEDWPLDIRETFGVERMTADEWWEENRRKFPETNRYEVAVIENQRDFEPNDQYAFNVVVYFHHPKHRIMKAFEKLVEQQQRVWGVEPSKEFPQFADYPLHRELSKATIKSLKTTLRVWDAYVEIGIEQRDRGILKKPDLYEVWMRAKTEDSLVFQFVTEEENGPDRALSRAIVRPHISRYLKWAKAIIINAQQGVFPCTEKL